MEPYDAEFRGEVLAACDTNEERRAIALRFKVSESWLRRIQQHQSQGSTRKSISSSMEMTCLSHMRCSESALSISVDESLVLQHD